MIRNIVGLISFISIYAPTTVSAISNTDQFGMIDLGTLRSDNGGSSSGFMVSNDGHVIVGTSATDNGSFRAFIYSQDDGKMIDLGTLRNNKSSGNSTPYGFSSNGRVVVGYAATDDGNNRRAFKYNLGDVRMTDLGTLRSDNSGESAARAVSADGRVVVGESISETYETRAFKYTDATGMVDLGTLSLDNSGMSYAHAVSADGRVVVGYASTTDSGMHAFRYEEDAGMMIDLGTLSSGSADSIANAVSANGRVTIGSSQTDSGSFHAFRHNKGDISLTDLGTLKNDNSGESYGFLVSADGRVVAGLAETESADVHAFRHREGDAKMTDLGTLRSDNSGMSQAIGISADGRVIVGSAQSDTVNVSFRAFMHVEGDAKITDLGTLRSDNSGSSMAYAVSADGRVIVGQAETDSGVNHAFVYRTKMVDAAESIPKLIKGADQQTAALSFLQDKLTDAFFQGCRPDAGGTCFNAGAKHYQQSNKAVDDTAAYVNIAHRFQPKLYAGLYLEQSVSSGFADSIGAKNEQPLVAVYGGFSPAGDANLGTQIRVAASTHKINADITRPSIRTTEAGKGSTNFKGYAGQVEAAYGIQATDKLIVSPVAGLRYSKVERGSYTEADTVDFPAKYGKIKSEQTSLYAGVQTDLNLSKQINLYAAAGLEQVLDHSEDTFSVTVPYIGGLKNSDPEIRNTRAYVFTGMSYQVAPNQKIGLGVGYRQSSFKSSRDGLSAQIGYQVQF